MTAHRLLTPRRRLLASLVVTSAVFAFIATAQSARIDAQVRTRPGTPQASTATSPTYSKADAEKLTRRLYLGLLGREPDPGGMASMTAEIQLGHLSAQVSQVLGSQEFRQLAGEKGPQPLLEQFYMGLLGRPAGVDGNRSYGARMQRGMYEPVVTEILSSAEFKRAFASATMPGAAFTGSALDCQLAVVEELRKTVKGRVYLAFDQPASVSNNPRTVSGPAVDRMETNRPLTYRCDGSGTSVSYADGGSARMPLPAAMFPASVRACHAAVADQIRRERNQASATFESVGTWPAGSQKETVRGQGMAGGAAFSYMCSTDGEQVTSSSYQIR